MTFSEAFQTPGGVKEKQRPRTTLPTVNATKNVTFLSLWHLSMPLWHVLMSIIASVMPWIH